MSEAIAYEAVKHWGFGAVSLKLVAQRENRVYRIEVQATQKSWALRVHRSGLRNEAELISENKWLQFLNENGLDVPSPVVSQTGKWCVNVRGHWVDVQEWLPGDTIIHHAEPDHYRVLGRAMATLHAVSDRWVIPTDFHRHSWNLEGLLGDDPVWGRFWENPALEKQQVRLLEQFRLIAARFLENNANTLDYGLIHADLVSENVLVDDGQQLHLIDFDDSGHGYRLFDLATVILRLQRNTGQEVLIDAFIKGYIEKRTLDTHELDLFLALRACTYIGWIITRLEEPDGKKRCAHYISTACTHVERWLNRTAA